MLPALAAREQRARTSLPKALVLKVNLKNALFGTQGDLTGPDTIVIKVHLPKQSFPLNYLAAPDKPMLSANANPHM